MFATSICVSNTFHYYALHIWDDDLLFMHLVWKPLHPEHIPSHIPDKQQKTDA